MIAFDLNLQCHMSLQVGCRGDFLWVAHIMMDLWTSRIVISVRSLASHALGNSEGLHVVIQGKYRDHGEFGRSTFSWGSLAPGYSKFEMARECGQFCRSVCRLFNFEKTRKTACEFEDPCCGASGSLGFRFEGVDFEELRVLQAVEHAKDSATSHAREQISAFDVELAFLDSPGSGSLLLVPKREFEETCSVNPTI